MPDGRSRASALQACSCSNRCQGHDVCCHTSWLLWPEPHKTKQTNCGNTHTTKTAMGDQHNCGAQEPPHKKASLCSHHYTQMLLAYTWAAITSDPTKVNCHYQNTNMDTLLSTAKRYCNELCSKETKWPDELRSHDHNSRSTDLWSDSIPNTPTN